MPVTFMKLGASSGDDDTVRNRVDVSAIVTSMEIISGDTYHYRFRYFALTL